MSHIEKKEMQKDLCDSRVNNHMVGDDGTPSRAPKSAEKTGDHDPMGESRNLIVPVTGTIYGTNTEVVPIAPTQHRGPTIKHH
ncbi:hypothetical protein HAX54_052664, partial [Datura stramonium]|nr:hypothetical protein [Datura stramonium]